MDDRIDLVLADDSATPARRRRHRRHKDRASAGTAQCEAGRQAIQHHDFLAVVQQFPHHMTADVTKAPPVTDYPSFRLSRSETWASEGHRRETSQIFLKA